MYYPRFTKAIIHHFITKDKSVSMRNRMFMHTAQADNILGPMRFFSKFDDFQVYGALLPNRMTNQQMRDSDAYKSYLAYATGAASPKMKRKLKKPASPLKKRTLVTVEEEEPEPAKKNKPKKAPAKVARRKGINLLSEAAYIEEAQLKKALKRSKREISIHKAGGSSEGANFELEVPDEPKGKSIDTSKCHGLKPGVPDVSTTNSSESENESWGNSGDEANEQSDDKRTESDNEPTETDNPKTSYDEEETQDDEFVHTPEDYVPTDDERNDESNDVTEEEYERINEELYGDVNVSLTDVEPADKEKDDKEMTVAGHVNVNQEGSVDTKVVSMLDINVQHEVPRTSPLLTIPVSVITEHNVINPPKTVITASATTISSLLTSLFPHLRQSTPILTPTTTEATTSTTAVSESKTLADI
ncbi:hypothetical protein Tco_1206752 [Tanacetum coccineum]